MRWAAVEAVQPVHRGGIGAGRAPAGRAPRVNIADVAAVRNLLALVCYGLATTHPLPAPNGVGTKPAQPRREVARG